MLATPALAGKGNGPGDGTGDREGEYGPGDCDQSSVEFTINNPLILASDQSRDQSRDHDGDGDGKDQSREQDHTREC